MQQKKTIVYISQPTYGGVIEYLYMFLKNIDKTKYNNILIISNEYIEKIERFEPYISKVYYLPMTREIKLKSVLSSIIKLKRILKKIKPDIVYMNSSMAGAVGRIALLFNTKVKTIYNAHGWYFNAKIGNKKKKMYALIEKVLALRTTTIINISQSEYNSALKYKIAPEKKMCLIENAIDFSKFENNEQYRNRTREKYGIKENEIVVGVVGRLSEQKDPMTSLKTFEILCKKYENLKLMYVGSGELEEEVKQYAIQKELIDKIIITGWVEDVEKYMSAFDIAILPSKWEGFGLVIVEYMACKKPIVASKIGGIPNIIQTKQNGYLAEIENAEEFAKKVEKYIKDKELVEKIVEYNYNYAKERFDIKKLIQEHEELFKEMFDKR